MIPVLLTLLSLAGAVALIAYVLSPLRQHETALTIANEAASKAAATQDPVALLREEREAALAGLAELDFDRSLGNISEEDYRHLRTEYRAQAIEILKSLDAHTPGRAISGEGKSQLRRPALRPYGIRPIEMPDRKAPHAQHPGHKASTATATATADSAVPLNGRAISFILGGIIAALAAIAIWIGWLRGPGISVSSPENAPALNIMHAHAALLVPNTNVALVAHHNGLLRSEDDGLNWLPVRGITSDVISLASGEANGPVIFMAAADTIMLSRDTGATWQPIAMPRAGGQIEALAAGDNKPTLLYAYLAGTGIYSTTDLQRWDAAGSQITKDVATLSLRPGPLAALYAASPGEGVLASGDEGRTWGSANGLLNGILPTLAVRALTFDAESGDQFTGPNGTRLAGAMYAGADQGLFKTIDGGSSWSPMSLRESLVAVSARSKPTPSILAVDSRSRLWRSGDRGNSWNTGNTGSVKP